jgi:hypothetical protein
MSSRHDCAAQESQCAGEDEHATDDGYSGQGPDTVRIKYASEEHEHTSVSLEEPMLSAVGTWFAKGCDVQMASD